MDSMRLLALGAAFISGFQPQAAQAAPPRALHYEASPEARFAEDSAQPLDGPAAARRTVEDLARIGRASHDFSPEPSHPDPNVARNAIASVKPVKLEISAAATIAFDEIAIAHAMSHDTSALMAMLRSRNAAARERAATVLASLLSSEVAVQLALARAVLLDNIRAARGATLAALAKSRPVDPGVLLLVFRIAVESKDADSRVSALEILDGMPQFDLAIHHYVQMSRGQDRALRHRPIETLRQIRRRKLDQLFDDVARRLPVDLLEEFFPG